ncbi:hypothetical protein R3P38DRAFT_2774473 [Favolaschia claudopus]|uniref:Ribonuclease H1 N-terminal domain-containing protein n=1 Tax=Favolaschia claudopus TaxID=2862362 RepID=A0AAW0BZW3_9AGAR
MSYVPTTALQPNVVCIVIPITSVLPAALVPAALPAPPPPSTKKDKEVVAKEPPKEVPRPLPGAGLPAPLVEHLRTEGPYLANEVFIAAPQEALAPVDEEVRAPEWYSITRGRFVGVVDQYALSELAITGVAGGARKSYESQAQALAAFNKALAWGIVQIVLPATMTVRGFPWYLLVVVVPNPSTVVNAFKNFLFPWEARNRIRGTVKPAIGSRSFSTLLAQPALHSTLRFELPVRLISLKSRLTLPFYRAEPLVYLVHLQFPSHTDQINAWSNALGMPIIGSAPPVQTRTYRNAVVSCIPSLLRASMAAALIIPSFATNSRDFSQHLLATSDLCITPNDHSGSPNVLTTCSGRVWAAPQPQGMSHSPDVPYIAAADGSPRTNLMIPLSSASCDVLILNALSISWFSQTQKPFPKSDLSVLLHPPTMPPKRLTVEEIAALMRPPPGAPRLSPQQLQAITTGLSEEELERLATLLGLADLVRQLNPLMGKLMRVSQMVVSRQPPSEDEDDATRIIRNLPVFDMAEADLGYTQDQSPASSPQEGNPPASGAAPEPPRSPSPPTASLRKLHLAGSSTANTGSLKPFGSSKPFSVSFAQTPLPGTPTSNSDSRSPQKVKEQSTPQPSSSSSKGKSKDKSSGKGKGPVVYISDSPPPSPPWTGSDLSTSISTASDLTETPPSSPTRPSTSPPTPRTPAPPSASRPAYAYSFHTPTRSGTTPTWFESGAATIQVSGSHTHRLRSETSLPPPSSPSAPRPATPAAHFPLSPSLAFGASQSGASQSSPSAPSSSIPGAADPPNLGGKAYAVFYGFEVGAYRTYPEVIARTHGYRNNVHCGFPTMRAAQAAIAYARGRGLTSDSQLPDDCDTTPRPPPTVYTENPLSVGADGGYYVVCRGIYPGIYRSWVEAALNTTGVNGNMSRKYVDREMAERVYEQARAEGWARAISRGLRGTCKSKVQIVRRRLDLEKQGLNTAIPTKADRPTHLPGGLYWHELPLTTKSAPATQTVQLWTLSGHTSSLPLSTLPTLSTLTFSDHAPSPASSSLISTATDAPWPPTTTMPRAKSNLSQKEVLLKRADAAYAYRQRNKASVNEKARLRMRRRRAELKLAPSAVQMEYLLRARKHRRDYRERVKRGGRRGGDKSSSRVGNNVVPMRRRQHSTPTSASSRSPPCSPCPPPLTVMSPTPSAEDDSGGEDYYDGEDEDDGEDWEDDDGAWQ